MEYSIEIKVAGGRGAPGNKQSKVFCAQLDGQG